MNLVASSLRSATSATNKNTLCMRHRVHRLCSDLVCASFGFAKQTSGTVRDLLPVLVASVTSGSSCCSSCGGTCCCTNCTAHCCTHRNGKPECEQCCRKTNQSSSTSSNRTTTNTSHCGSSCSRSCCHLHTLVVCKFLGLDAGGSCPGCQLRLC